MTREEAKKTIHELMKACVPNSNYYIVGEMAIKALEQEPRKGHWIMTNDYFTGYVKCSCCGEDSLEEGNYCPNCGADMREVEE